MRNGATDRSTNSADPGGIDDHQLGQRLASILAEQAARQLPSGATLARLQDLLGADTTLLGPLRDLLARPAFHQLISADQRSLLVGGRDALLQELAVVYHPLMLARLAAVIDGCLGLPAGSPAAAGAPATQTPPAPLRTPAVASPSGGQASGGRDPRSVSATSADNVRHWPNTTPSAPPAPAQAPASRSSGAIAVLIAALSSIAGAVLLAMVWLVMANRPPDPATPSLPNRAPDPSPSATSTPTPKAPGDSPAPSPPQGAWGGASDYKFGQLPGGEFPHSCAFSRTDPQGRVTISKSEIEYWSCHDMGGSADRGYRVRWVDGKETHYSFGANGVGTVVGTNGSTYPMSWRNDSHRGSPIVVISHEDGATTWIPGAIN
ncbi:MAG: hypothetical protein VKK62_00995 [Synechococcaceae cyanobacterium]|nr:hypothetical protein [Synechococcaceae cyanobacterium]